MKYPLEVYDKVFKELKDHYQDRVYPYFFDNKEDITFNGIVELSEKDNLVHEKTPIFTFNGDENTFSIDFDKRNLERAFKGNLIFSSDLFSEIQNEIIVEVKLSNYKGGLLPVYEYVTTVTELTNNLFSIELVQPNHDESESSRNLTLTNISNITVTFKGELDGKIKLEDFVFINKGHAFSLEDIDLYLESAYEELDNYYGDSNLPKKLWYTIPTLASGNIWSALQGNEDEGTRTIEYGSKQVHASRLIKKAFSAIDKYKSQLDKKKNDLPFMGVIKLDRT